MNRLVLKPIKKINGSLTLPGSKSLSKRALLLSSIATGTTVLENMLLGEDTSVMNQALKQLG
ncbi:MAG: 3-phosphoshikimate 1-carboxyvinyltransferase, partial [Pseudomonadota bacterium]|nr:3-phosphoshikimate 1-carboxyvinyltransferase [Pseudomonadota bacterium]